MAEQPTTEQPPADVEQIARDALARSGWTMTLDEGMPLVRATLDALAAAGRLREARKPLHKLPPKERRTIRQAEADDRLRVDDPDREKLAGALHDIDCGWNCPGHGIVQEAQDRRYRRMADVALRTLARRLLPEGASTAERVAEALALAERRLGALHYTSIGGLPFVGREHIFVTVNDTARDVGVWDAYVAAARAAGPGPRGELLSPLELARRNGDVPSAPPVSINEESTDER